MTHHLARSLAIASLASVALVPTVAGAMTVGNLTYTQAELEKPISLFGGDGSAKFPTGPTGSNTVLVLHGYMILMGSYDSGKPPGSIHTFDISNPRKPVLLHTLDGTPETSKLRELHAMPVAMIDGKDFIVLPTTEGLQFFDFTDPLNPKPSGAIKLTGVNGGDYDNAAWMLSWGWPYVYAGGTGNGVYIVDATDPANPTLVTRMTSPEIGNFRVGPTYTAGNYLIANQMDQGTTHFSIIDASDPKKPFLLTTGMTPDSLYSSVVIGDHIYGPGTNGSYSFMKWSPDAVTIAHRDTSGSDRGGYCSYTDGFLICGQSSEGYKKWDVRDDTQIKQVGHGVDPDGVGGDFDFATAIGNMVYLGNDHGTGAALIPHMMAPDTTPPKVLNIYPKDMDQKLALTSRFTTFFSDDIDLDSVTAKNIIVRKNGGCDPVDGVFSKSSFNAITFGAKQPLEANATYDLVVPVGGIKDLMGNAITTGAVAHFSTGTTVDPVMPCPGDGDVSGPGTGSGGSGGMAAGGAAGAAPVAGTGGLAGGTGGMTDASGSTSGGASAAGTATVVPMAGTGGTGTTAPPAASSGDTGGCGCSVPGRAPLGGGAALLLGLGALFARRRRPGAEQ